VKSGIENARRKKKCERTRIEGVWGDSGKPRSLAREQYMREKIENKKMNGSGDQ
jgi:hypothetical protein